LEAKIIENKTEWDNFLSKFEYTTMFLSWEWGLFEKSLGNKFEFWGIYENNELVALLPIKYVKALRGKYLYLRHAPLMDWKNNNLVVFVTDFIRKKAEESKSYFIRISPLLESSDENEKLMKELGFKSSLINATDAELTVVLDLTKSEEDLWKDFRKTTRNSIKTAINKGITVKSTDTLDFFKYFEPIYLDTIKRQKWHGYSLQYIKKEFEVFQKSGDVRMFVAFLGEQPISTSIFIHHRKQIIYHHSGSLTQYRNIPSTYLLHWEAIKYYKSIGMELYNFWGVCPENETNHPWYGLSLFKRGFTKDELSHIHPHDLLISPLGSLTRIYEGIETKLRGY